MDNFGSSLIEFDASGEHQPSTAFSALVAGSVDAVRVRGLVAEDACMALSRSFLGSRDAVMHDDVEGLRVIGDSHFQTVRKKTTAYLSAQERMRRCARLRDLSKPFGSPFDSAVAMLAQIWNPGCKFMTLPSEGDLAPYTVRIYDTNVGIGPHRDELSVESPSDRAARSLSAQFGANIYLSMPSGGGELEIFGDYDVTDWPKDLSQGPPMVSRSSLGAPTATLRPEVGEMIVFSSRALHAVKPTSGGFHRITVSFFVGFVENDLPLVVWA